MVEDMFEWNKAGFFWRETSTGPIRTYSNDLAHTGGRAGRASQLDIYYHQWAGGSAHGPPGRPAGLGDWTTGLADSRYNIEVHHREDRLLHNPRRAVVRRVD